MRAIETGNRSRQVREMFGAIAGRYDFLNHLLSANADRRWRNACFQEVAKRIRRPSPKILDVGCGTADLALIFSRLGPVVGCDFCLPMIEASARKVKEKHRGAFIALLAADALALPFAANTFDVVVSAFVLRNLSDIEQGLLEMRRVLRAGGVMGVLDFGMPGTPLLAALYRVYFLRIVPKIGRMLSGVDGAYGYLPASVQAFPPAEELKKAIERAGFADVEYRKLTAGVAVLLIGTAAKD